MPLGGLPTCRYRDCKNVGNETHHIVYAVGDKRHFYCRHSVKKGGTSEPHGEETVPLCRRHHQSITDYNERCWRINRYHPLSCAQRRHFFQLWMNGKYPEGVEPDPTWTPTNPGKVYK